MANIEEMIYTFTNSTASSHFSKSGGMNLGQAGLVSNPLILWFSNSGTATMNDTGKSFLYPKAGIHPFKADYTFILWNGTDSNLTSNPSSYMNFYFKIDGNTIYHKEVAPGKTSSPTTASDAITNDTNPAILNSTSSSSIVFEITAQKNGLTQMCGISSTDDYQCFIKFYYQQWDLIGYSTGDGAQAVMSPGRVYAGETVTFSTLLNDNSIFHGWYSDAEHTQLVSTNQTYEVTASEDLVLYAYATKKPDKYNNKLYFKGKSNNSKWKHPYSIYKKTINGWELQSNINNIPEEYNYSNASVVHDLDNTIYRVTAKVRTEPYTIYFLNNNLSNRPLTSISNSTSFEFIPIEEGLALIYNGNYNSSTQTLTVQWYSIEDFLIRTMTIEATPQTYTQEIYFIDKDGNKFTETKISNEAYTVTTPSGYTNFIGWKEYCGSVPTGRILEVGQNYYDVGSNKQIYYTPVFNE